MTRAPPARHGAAGLAGAEVPASGALGGSGLYESAGAVEGAVVELPSGMPRAPVVVGGVAGRRVPFLPRHGRDHRFPPHRIPYRANLWALRAIGVRQVIAPSAVGSLTSSYAPGTLSVPDQLVDRTASRAQTFYDDRAAVPAQLPHPHLPAPP